MGKDHRNICIFKDFKGVGQFPPPSGSNIGNSNTLVQIGLTLRHKIKWCTWYQSLDMTPSWLDIILNLTI